MHTSGTKKKQASHLMCRCADVFKIKNFTKSFNELLIRDIKSMKSLMHANISKYVLVMVQSFTGYLWYDDLSGAGYN